MNKPTQVWMPLYIGDYLGDTGHLTTEQHGAYLLLILACFRRCGSLPDDDAQLASITKMVPKDWRRISTVMRAFFYSEGGLLWHKRVKAEAEKAVELSQKRREAGAKAVAKRWQTDSKRIASAPAGGEQSDTQSQSHRLTPNPTRIGADENTGLSVVVGGVRT